MDGASGVRARDHTALCRHGGLPQVFVTTAPHLPHRAARHYIKYLGKSGRKFCCEPNAKVHECTYGQKEIRTYRTWLQYCSQYLARQVALYKARLLYIYDLRCVGDTRLCCAPIGALFVACVSCLWPVYIPRSGLSDSACSPLLSL